MRNFSSFRRMVYTLVYKDAASILIIVSSSSVDFNTSLKMERERRLMLLDCLMAIQRNQMHILIAQIQAILDRRKEKTCWVRHWITLRPDKDAYGNLVHLLRKEDVKGFRNFTRIATAMFADMVTRLTPRLQKYDTWYRKALPVSLKVAITMRYFASADSYHSLIYLFYVPHSTPHSWCWTWVRSSTLSMARRPSATHLLQRGGRTLPGPSPTGGTSTITRGP